MTAPATPATPRVTRLTGRAAVLAVVICAIALSLAYPVREYIGQRQQIGQLLTQQHAMLAQVKSLQAEQSRLSSRSYVEQLAEQELDMCFPDSACYVIEGRQPVSAPAPAGPAGPQPWYAKLWQSVERAGATPRRPAR